METPLYDLSPDGKELAFTADSNPAANDTNLDVYTLAIGSKTAVNRTSDGGRSFETLRHGLPQTDCYDLVYRHGLCVGRDGRTLLMGTTTGNLWATGDGGDTWQPLGHHLPPVHAVRLG